MSSRAPAEDEGTAHALAEEAYELVQADPQRAKTIAAHALAAARVDGDRRAEVAALHSLSWAQHVLGDVSAERTAREGIRIGTRIGDGRGVALLRRLALTLAF